MKCSSGQHEWTDPICAERCCDPMWMRQQRTIHEDRSHFDPEGQVFSSDGLFVFGWVKAVNFTSEGTEVKPEDLLHRVLTKLKERPEEVDKLKESVQKWDMKEHGEFDA